MNSSTSFCRASFCVWVDTCQKTISRGALIVTLSTAVPAGLAVVAVAAGAGGVVGKGSGVAVGVAPQAASIMLTTMSRARIVLMRFMKNSSSNSCTLQ